MLSYLGGPYTSKQNVDRFLESYQSTWSVEFSHLGTLMVSVLFGFPMLFYHPPLSHVFVILLSPILLPPSYPGYLSNPEASERLLERQI